MKAPTDWTQRAKKRIKEYFGLRYQYSNPVECRSVIDNFVDERVDESSLAGLY